MIPSRNRHAKALSVVFFFMYKRLGKKDGTTIINGMSQYIDYPFEILAFLSFFAASQGMSYEC